jgi:chromate transporter
LVFGGGHVVLPLLVAEFSSENLISKEVLVAGYGAAQALPGPLFAISSFLGATILFDPSEFFAPILGSAVALVAIFLPSFLLLFGIFPAWSKLKEFVPVQRALYGINAAVVGLLAAVLLDPLTTQMLSRWSDVLLVLLSFLLMQLKGWPSWAVVMMNGGLAFLTTLFLN